MTWEEIEKEFEIAPIWLNWLTIKIGINTKARVEYDAIYKKHGWPMFDCPKHPLMTLTEFTNYKITDPNNFSKRVYFWEYWRQKKGITTNE